MVKRIVVTVMAIAFPVMLLVGCGGPPKEEMEKTKMNKTKAMEAKADTYAKDLFDAAAAAETAGADAVKKSDWDKAKKSYADAAKKFEDAGKAAPAGHDAMKADLTARMAKLEADHNDKAMADMKKKMGTMKKDEKAAMEKMVADCKANEAAAKDLIAKDDLVAAGEKIAADEKTHADMALKLNPPKKDAAKK
jgi:hypothetical protein